MDQAGRHLDDSDVAAEAPVHLREFQSDIAAAHNDQMTRNKVDSHHRAVCQIGDLLETTRAYAMQKLIEAEAYRDRRA
jgi:hypothetical protein